jgi:hypothetical protein
LAAEAADRARIEESLRWPQVKTLCQKLMKIDILLSHVKLHKMSIITHL